MTPEQLQQAMGCTDAIARTWAKPLTDACARFFIDSPARLAAFIAQVGHESASLTALSENLNYSAEALVRVWPTRLTPLTATAYARQPEKIANLVYANRMGNGPEITGDGWRYRGRGPIQITGKANYGDAGQAIGEFLVPKPERVLEPAIGALVAAWFWSNRGLNRLADAGEFDKITKAINGGTNGAADRQDRHERAKKVFK